MTPPPPAADRRSTIRRVAATLALVALVLFVAPSSSARQARGLGTETTAANVTLQVIVTGTDGGVKRHRDGGRPGGARPTRPVRRELDPRQRQVVHLLGAGGNRRHAPAPRLGQPRSLERLRVHRDRARARSRWTRAGRSWRRSRRRGSPSSSRAVSDGFRRRMTSPEADLSCSGNGNCATSVPAFAEVTFKATPVAEFEKWSGACQEAGTAPTCTLVLSGDDVVGAKFKDDPDEPDIIPPRQQAELRVVVEGGGKVVSSRSRLSESDRLQPQLQGEVRARRAADADRAGRAVPRVAGRCPLLHDQPHLPLPRFRDHLDQGRLGPGARTGPGAAPTPRPRRPRRPRRRTRRRRCRHLAPAPAPPSC